MWIGIWIYMLRKKWSGEKKNEKKGVFFIFDIFYFLFGIDFI